MLSHQIMASHHHHHYDWPCIYVQGGLSISILCAATNVLFVFGIILLYFLVDPSHTPYSTPYQIESISVLMGDIIDTSRSINASAHIHVRSRRPSSVVRLNLMAVPARSRERCCLVTGCNAARSKEHTDAMSVSVTPNHLIVMPPDWPHCWKLVTITPAPLEQRKETESSR
jgi:hypothetical protein